MFDNYNEVWLWQGSHSENVNEDVDDDDIRKYDNKSNVTRWHIERKMAMETVLSYCEMMKTVRNLIDIPAYLVSSGFEPLQFTNLFCPWTGHTDIKRTQLLVSF